MYESQNISMQVQQVIRKANRMLANIARGIDYKSREIMLQLYIGEIAFKVLCTVLLSLFKERCKCIGSSSEKVY